MTALQTFIDFAKTLPKDRQGELDAELTDLMLRLQAPEEWALSPEQEAEDLRRARNPNRTIADPDQIDAFFAKYQ